MYYGTYLTPDGHMQAIAAYETLWEAETVTCFHADGLTWMVDTDIARLKQRFWAEVNRQAAILDGLAKDP